MVTGMAEGTAREWRRHNSLSHERLGCRGQTHARCSGENRLVTSHPSTNSRNRVLRAKANYRGEVGWFTKRVGELAWKGHGKPRQLHHH